MINFKKSFIRLNTISKMFSDISKIPVNNFLKDIMIIFNGILVFGSENRNTNRPRLNE